MVGRRLPLFATAPGAARVCRVVMKANVRANQSAMLDAEEASLRARLLAILPGAAASLTANWMVTGRPGETPSEDELRSFLTGHSITYGVGYWGGFSTTVAPADGAQSIGVGVFTPQIGVSYNYQNSNWLIYNTNIKL